MRCSGPGGSCYGLCLRCQGSSLRPSSVLGRPDHTQRRGGRGPRTPGRALRRGSGRRPSPRPSTKKGRFSSGGKSPVSKGLGVQGERGRRSFSTERVLLGHESSGNGKIHAPVQWYDVAHLAGLTQWSPQSTSASIPQDPEDQS